MGLLTRTKIKRIIISCIIVVLVFNFMYIELVLHEGKNYQNKKVSTKIDLGAPAFAMTKVPISSIDKFEQDYCRHNLGDIAIVQVMSGKDYVEQYVFNALQSLRCYARLRNYTLYQIMDDHMIDSVSGKDNDLNIYLKCKHFVGILRNRHCLITYLLEKHDYVVHIDADSGVINPRHCFEDYISPDVDISFLVRAHSGEVQAGHYIVKNTTFSRDFLLEWANMSEENDQPALHSLLSKRFLSLGQHEKCQEQKNETYFKWIACIRNGLSLEQHKKTVTNKNININSNRNNSGNKSRIMLYSRAQTFVRDGWTTGFKWAETDFMLHAMKGPDDVLFSRKLNRSDCSATVWNIPVVKSYYVDTLQKMKEVWRQVEKSHQVKYKQFALIEDISSCWPDCTNVVL